MVNELPSETQAGTISWAQDQLYQLKAQVAQLEQELEQVRQTTSTLSEGADKTTLSLQDVALNAGQTPRLQEELNQTIALVVQLQDKQAETKQRIDQLARSRGLDEDHDLEEWGEAVKRTAELERQVERLLDRQSSVDENNRRHQEELSLLREQVQQMETRLQDAQTKSTKSFEGAAVSAQKAAQAEAAIDDLRQQDEAIAERARVAADGLTRIEGVLRQNLDELGRLELLAERIELHRAERQRLEDRALKLEEELRDLTARAEKAEHQRGKLSTQHASLASRFESLQEQVEEHRKGVLEHIRKLTATQDRTKRRQIQELERELREMKQYVADLSQEEV